MYEKHFGLTAPPFTIAPDPRYLFMSEQHREALAHLVYGIRHGGFVLLTGEVGTGKTTVCRGLLARVPESTDVALVLNPRLTAPELLATICDELGIGYPSGNTSAKLFVDGLNAYLLKANAQGRSTVLIIDEAQNLSADVLEQMRLLTNLETNERKLLQIIMVGQPELSAMLARPELRQLAQRVTARYHIGRLSRRDTSDYIAHRLGIAGATRTLFPPAALRQVYGRSGGIPRLINTICDRALLGAYVTGADAVTRGIVARAASEVLGTPISRWRFPARVSVGLVLTGGAALAAGYYHFDRHLTSSRPATPVAAHQSTPAPAPAAALSLASQSALSLRLTDAAPVPRAEQDAAAAAKPLDAGQGLDWPPAVPRESSGMLAYQALFERWGGTYRPQDSRTACEQAAAIGLACLYERGNLGSLRRYDRPAVLTLHAGDGTPRFATLLGLSASTGTVVIAGQHREVPITALETAWQGQYTLLWRPPPGYQKAFGASVGGPLGHWLQAHLARLPEGGAGDMATRVMQFQARNGLIQDGILGPRTLIELSTATEPQVPRLTRGRQGG